MTAYAKSDAHKRKEIFHAKCTSLKDRLPYHSAPPLLKAAMVAATFFPTNALSMYSSERDLGPGGKHYLYSKKCHSR